LGNFLSKLMNARDISARRFALNANQKASQCVLVTSGVHTCAILLFPMSVTHTPTMGQTWEARNRMIFEEFFKA
jgi:hypothetical protein